MTAARGFLMEECEPPLEMVANHRQPGSFIVTKEAIERWVREQPGGRGERKAERELSHRDGGGAVK